MKKIISILLLVVLAMSLTISSASASDPEFTNWAFGFNASTDGSTLRQSNNYQWKVNVDKNYIEVRHAVTGSGSSAGYTNYMMAKIELNGYVGAKWHAPNMIYYTCTSSAISQIPTIRLAPGGRANTKYKEFLGLNNILLEGQFRTH